MLHTKAFKVGVALSTSVIISVNTWTILKLMQWWCVLLHFRHNCGSRSGILLVLSPAFWSCQSSPFPSVLQPSSAWCTFTNWIVWRPPTVEDTQGEMP